MNYKKLLPNLNIRLKLLKLFDFLPDKQMVKLQYKISTGRKLNLNKPVRFTEKLQWYKLYYRDSLMTKCSDKYDVREYIIKKGYSNILVPLYGVFNCVDQINFNLLPTKFVLKTTNGSHTNIFCENKTELDINKVKRTLKQWLNIWNGKIGREWAYYNIKPRIICEKYLERDNNNDLIDYKIFCFNGKPFYIYVITERFQDGGAKLGVFDMDFNQLPYKRVDITKLDKDIIKPVNFKEMINIAKALSEDFPHVRVDLYNTDGKIYFGELTFYNGSGYKGYEPEEFDFIVGETFKLPEKRKE